MRVWAWIGSGACAVVAAGLIAVALATDLDTAGQIAGIVGAVLAVAALVCGLYAFRAPGANAAGGGPRAVVEAAERSVAAGQDIGAAATGDRARVRTASAPAAPPPAPGASGPPAEVRTTGERGIAAGGSIGAAATGDDSVIGP